MGDKELLDLKSLTNKELLVRLTTELEGVKEKISGIESKLVKSDQDARSMMIDIAVVKTKVMMWGALGGIAASIVVSIVSLFFQHFIAR